MHLTRQSKYDYWFAIMKGWEASGETQSDFCERKGVKLSNFSMWRQRIKQRQSSDQTQGVSNNFIEAKVVESEGANTDHSVGYTLQLANGIQLRIPIHCTLSQLTTLFKSLKVIL